MKLLLTSEGWDQNPKIAEKFLEVLDRLALNTKVLIFISLQTNKDKQYLELVMKSLKDYNIKEENIKILNAEHEISYEEAKKYDVIYFCGGNTFYLLDRIRKTGFDKIIKKFVKEPNKVYFGVSAGSIIAGPGIEISSIGDENEVGLKDFKGLGLVDLVISPHYCEEERDAVEEFKKKTKYKVIPLTDKQALLVIDGKVEMIE